jgi:hypothetical protein
MRVSINRRIERIRDHYLPPGSLEWRIDRLPPNLKQAWRLWTERCAAIISAHEKYDGRCRYELLCDGFTITPPMPRAVHAALWPDGETDHAITADMSVADAAAVYADLVESTVK